MKKSVPRFSTRLTAPLIAVALTILLAGCASEKAKPVAQRGWIGGEYVLAKPASFVVTLSSTPGVVGALPKPVQHIQKAAILVTKLGTNAPAELAGLRKGDLVLELNHQPVTRLQDFRRTIDRSEPGTWLAVKAYRDGRMLDYSVPVGREKYKKGGYFLLAFPTVVHRWDLWPNPGFSLVVLGYEPNPGVRREPENDPKTYDQEWQAYLGFFEVSYGKRVVSQERVSAGKGT